MRYRNAREVFPAAIVEKLQEYVEGMYIYIPKKEESKKKWGESTSARERLQMRNAAIYQNTSRVCQNRNWLRDIISLKKVFSGSFPFKESRRLQKKLETAETAVGEEHIWMIRNIWNIHKKYLSVFGTCRIRESWKAAGRKPS